MGACVCRGGGGGAQTVTVEVSVQSGEVWVEHVLTPPPRQKRTLLKIETPKVSVQIP